MRWEPVPGALGFRLHWQPEGERCPSRTNRLGSMKAEGQWAESSTWVKGGGTGLQEQKQLGA